MPEPPVTAAGQDDHMRKMDNADETDDTDDDNEERGPAGRDRRDAMGRGASECAAGPANDPD